jgi:hypothetical protein
MSAGSFTAANAASRLALPAMALRVTTVFPREEDGWKRVLRYADRIVPTAG